MHTSVRLLALMLFFGPVVAPLAWAADSLNNLENVSDSELGAASQSVVAAVDHQRLKERYAKLAEEKIQLINTRQKLAAKLAAQEELLQTFEKRLTAAEREQQKLVAQLALREQELQAQLRRQQALVTSAPKEQLNSTAGVTDVVKGWARSWSAQDVPAYLAYYAEDFRPENGSSRSSWERLRRKRLTQNRNIQVALENLETSGTETNLIAVTFEQTYRSDRYSDTVTKRLRLKNENGRWKILQEKVLP